MLQNFSLFIANYFMKNGVIEQDDADVIQYGVELIITTLFSFITILMFGLFVGKEKEAVVYLTILVGVKQLVGGYHAKTYSSCVMLTIGIFLVNLGVYYRADFVDGIYWLLFGISAFFIICVFSPCGHKNRPIGKEERKKVKFFAIVATLTTALCALLLYRLEMEIYRFIVLVLVTLAINLIIGLYEERRKSYE